MTAVERSTRCIVGWSVVWERTESSLQAILDAAPYASHYYTDAFNLYQSVVYAGTHTALHNKSQTYSVEGDNAELRHYLARLARRSRCFSRSIDALRRAVQLFVFAFNRRQLHKRAYPKYPSHLQDFLSFSL